LAKKSKFVKTSKNSKNTFFDPDSKIILSSKQETLSEIIARPKPPKQPSHSFSPINQQQLFLLISNPNLHLISPSKNPPLLSATKCLNEGYIIFENLQKDEKLPSDPITPPSSLDHDLNSEHFDSQSSSFPSSWNHSPPSFLIRCDWGYLTQNSIFKIADLPLRTFTSPSHSKTQTKTLIELQMYYPHWVDNFTDLYNTKKTSSSLTNFIQNIASQPFLYGWTFCSHAHSDHAPLNPGYGSGGVIDGDGIILSP
jgi:hypothetical protein